MFCGMNRSVFALMSLVFSMVGLNEIVVRDVCVSLSRLQSGRVSRNLLRPTDCAFMCTDILKWSHMSRFKRRV